MTKIEIITKCREVLDQCGDNPSDEMIKMGQAMLGIGKALEGRSIAEARAIVESVAALEIAGYTGFSEIIVRKVYVTLTVNMIIRADDDADIPDILDDMDYKFDLNTTQADLESTEIENYEITDSK